MFGYVNIYKPELKVKDYTRYRAYYCGLCQVLQKEYGILGKMTLSYDMTFLIVFLSSIYEPQEKQEKNRCMVHPVDKISMITNEITEYAASMNIVLMYYKFVDDWMDEKKPVAMMGIRSLHKAFRQIEQKYPDKCRNIHRCLSKLAKEEAKQVTNLDHVSRCFGELMSELFTYKQDIWEEDIRRMAFYLGKYIYILDAYDDIEEDRKKEHYNPLKPLYEECNIQVKNNPIEFRKLFGSRCEEILTLMMAECTFAYEKLPCVLNADILSNILYVGVWNKFDAKNKKCMEQMEDAISTEHNRESVISN